MSWQRHLINGFLRIGKWQLQHLRAGEVRAAMRFYMNRVAALQLPPSWVRRRLEVVGGVVCEWVAVPETEQEPGVVIYCHGGGFMAGGPASHRDLAWRLSRASGQRVLLVDYRLAPEAPFPAQLDDVAAVYRALLAAGTAPERIALAGDSAGANLVLAVALALRDADAPLPAALVCWSAWADLTHSGESIRRNAGRDALLPPSLLAQVAAFYIGDRDPHDSLISPVFADFTGLPPLLLHAAEEELLLDDTLRIARSAQAAGVRVECRIWPGVPHAFPVFAQLLPEGRDAIAQAGNFLQRRLVPEQVAA
jgi:acetyl esterase/lipase